MEEHECTSWDWTECIWVVAGCAWVPEERIWAPEVFIVGEARHFIVDNSVRLMAQLNHTNIIAAELGLRTYGHQHTQQHKIPHTRTTTQGHGDVGEKREWQGTNVGGKWTTGVGCQCRAVGNHITNCNADTTQNGQPPPPPHHTLATTPKAPPTPQQQRHQQWRNAHTHATTTEGSPGQPRTAQKRRVEHCGPG